MVAPIDYTAGQAAPTDFLRSIQGGLQVGAQIQQQQQAAVQQQAAQAAAAAYSADAQSAMANPTPQAFAALALKYPSQREAVKQSWDGLSEAEKKSEGDTMSQAYAALLAGKPEVAKSVVQNQIDARKNTGLDTSHFDSALQLLDTDPQKAQAALGFTLSHIGDPKDFAAKFGALQGEQRAEDLAPAELRKANAVASTDEAEAAGKNLGLVAQQAGALAASANVKPGQATTFFKAMGKQGLISPEQTQAYIDGMPSNPKDIPAYLNQIKTAGLSATEQMKYTTPTAGEKLSAETSRYATNVSAGTAAARLKFDKDQAEAGDAPDNTPQNEKDLWVHRYIAGNGEVPRNSPTTVKNNIAKWAAGMGITPNDLSTGAAQAKYDQATAVTSGHRGGAMASVEATLPALAENASALSHQLGQGSFVPLNKLTQMTGDQISDPKVAAFKVAHQALVSEYQQVISRGGTNVTALNEAMHVLNSARSMQAYDAAVDQVKKEVAINVAGTKAVRAGLGMAGHAAPAAQPATPGLAAGWSVTVHP